MEQARNFTARIGCWSAQHRKRAIFGWLAFVVAAVAIGFNVLPAKEIDQRAGGPGESGQAAKAIDGAFPDKSAEQVLVQSERLKAGDEPFKAAVADVTRRLEGHEGRGERRRPVSVPTGRSPRTGTRRS